MDSDQFDELTESPVRTGGGDDGRSSLIDGSRRFKDDISFVALGTIDEAQVTLGVCRALIPDAVAKDELSTQHYGELGEILAWIQHKLIIAGGVVACSPGEAIPEWLTVLDDTDVNELLSRFEYWRSLTRIEPRFFIAGDTRLGAEFDRCRTVVRRAERAVVRVVRERGIPEQIVVSRFLNILSDFCFTAARWADGGRATASSR